METKAKENVENESSKSPPLIGIIEDRFDFVKARASDQAIRRPPANTNAASQPAPRRRSRRRRRPTALSIPVPDLHPSATQPPYPPAKSSFDLKNCVIGRILRKECICKVCNNVLPLELEEEGLIMSKCECTFALMHQQCAIHQSKNINTENTTNCCDVCHQNIQIADVNLSRIPRPLPMYTNESALSPRDRYATMKRQEDEYIIVKVKPAQRKVDGEEDEKIPKMEAVCKICFGMLQENSVDVLIKTKCKCRFTLMHENCAIKCSENKGNNKCAVCEEDVQTIQVTLSSPNISIENQENTASAYKRITKPFSWLLKLVGKA